MNSSERLKSEMENFAAEKKTFWHEIGECGRRVFSRLNPNVLPPADHPINTVRYSLFYRIKSLDHHLHMLINQRREINKQIKHHMENRTSNPVLIENLIVHQYYIFDDIVFNLLSMFDYLSTMIGYMFEGKFYEWNNLVSLAKNRNSKISNELFSKKIIELDEAWIQPIIKFGNDIFHEAPKFGDESINKGGFKKNIPYFDEIKVHDELNNLLQSIEPIYNFRSNDIVDCSIMIIMHSFVECTKLLKEIK